MAQRYLKTLQSSQILKILKPFNATLTGTFPIDIAIESSDLDIPCFVTDFDLFREVLVANFQTMEKFTIRERKDLDAVIASFEFEGFVFEIFGQPVEVEKQQSYLHMIAEKKILEFKGDAFRREIIALKRAGFKTEPAFAKALDLDGDPYQTVLDYAGSLIADGSRD